MWIYNARRPHTKRWLGKGFLPHFFLHIWIDGYTVDGYQKIVQWWIFSRENTPSPGSLGCKTPPWSIPVTARMTWNIFRMGCPRDSNLCTFICHCCWQKHPKYPSSQNHGSVKNGCISKSTYLSNTAILHFHDYGRKSNYFELDVQRGVGGTPWIVERCSQDLDSE